MRGNKRKKISGVKGVVQRPQRVVGEGVQAVRLDFHPNTAVMHAIVRICYAAYIS